MSELTTTQKAAAMAKLISEHEPAREDVAALRERMAAMAARWEDEANNEPDYPGHGVVLDTLRNCANALRALAASPTTARDDLAGYACPKCGRLRARTISGGLFCAYCDEYATRE